MERQRKHGVFWLRHDNQDKSLTLRIYKSTQRNKDTEGNALYLCASVMILIFGASYCVLPNLLLEKDISCCAVEKKGQQAISSGQHPRLK